MMKEGGIIVFPFHYGSEADSYTFYRVPKILFTEKIFEHLSTDAKLLYGILLDRMQLSMKNGWLDEEGKVYIYYTIESIMEALTCGNKKAGQLLAELDDRKGIGLISRVRQGLGKPDRIYVHKCIVPEVSKGHFQKCQNNMSGDVEETSQEMSKGHTNNTNENNNEINDTDLILSADGYRYDEMSVNKRDVYRAYFLNQCGFEILKDEYPHDMGMLDEILDLLVDVCCSNQKTIRISGDDKPVQVVKSRLMKLNEDHIRYVLGCFKENTTKIRNIKQYLLASLYNASMTIDSYYSALVRHDLYGADKTQL